MEFATRLWTRSIAVLTTVACAVPAVAQITTGAVSGTIRDAQGGIIPGATVTLVNETQATRSAPVVSDQSGDFRFVNVTPTTYTIEVEMPSFKTLKRRGIDVGPGSRGDGGPSRIGTGGRTETVTVKGESPLVQSGTGERSFTIPPEEVESLPLADRNFATLATLAPGVDGTSRIGGGGATN